MELIDDSLIDRPRRPRVNPRVVKVKMSKYNRKRSKDKSKYKNFENDIKIIPEEAAALNSFTGIGLKPLPLAVVI